MGYTGASRKTPNDTLWEMLSLRLSRPISAPLLTAIQGTCGYLHHSWQLSRAPAVPAPLLAAIQGTCRYLHHSWQLFCQGDTLKRKDAEELASTGSELDSIDSSKVSNGYAWGDRKELKSRLSHQMRRRWSGFLECWHLDIQPEDRVDVDSGHRVVHR